MLLANADWLEVADFPLAIPTVGAKAGVDFQLPAHGVDLESLEQSLVIQALERCGGNQTRAATLLGMNRDQIRYRIEKYGLVRPQHA
jgi:DNA-binding NtrC family response regulator